MAERRMFAKQIVESDAFTDIPLSAQALYFQLGMEADDEGVVNKPRKVARSIGASDTDLDILIEKRFLIPFDNGIVIIKHWKVNNYIQKDRFKKSVYQEELSTLSVKDNGVYTNCIQTVSKLYTEPETLENTGCIQTVYKTDTQDSIGQDRLGKDSLGKTTDNNSDSGGSLITRLSDSEWDSLDSMYENLLDLLDEVEKPGADYSEIRNPYKYILGAAAKLNWPVKTARRKRHDG